MTRHIVTIFRSPLRAGFYAVPGGRVVTGLSMAGSPEIWIGSLTSGQSIRREDVAGPSGLSQGLAHRQKPGREVHSLSSTDILVMPDRVIPETRSRRAHFGGLGR